MIAKLKQAVISTDALFFQLYSSYNYGDYAGPNTYYTTSQLPEPAFYNYYKHGYERSSQDYPYFINYSTVQSGHSPTSSSWAGQVFSMVLRGTIHGCSIMQLVILKMKKGQFSAAIRVFYYVLENIDPIGISENNDLTLK